ncbi:hypothetical protein OG225_06880 [Nocardia sp. NBC_01377]|uniref:hypothetical protein n=1 Tax=Nocardia sp. NBC_01377 TaxID=2903595 RepID=UPI00324EBCC1
MSDAHEQMKRLRVQRDQEAGAKAAQATKAQQQREADEIRQAEILSELVMILRAEGRVPSCPLYEDGGIVRSRVLKIMKGHNFRFIGMVWNLAAGWGNVEFFPTFPALTAEQELISVSREAMQSDYRQPPPRALDHGPGVIIQQQRRDDRFVHVHVPAGNRAGGDVRLVDLDREGLAGYYLGAVDSNPRRI